MICHWWRQSDGIVTFVSDNITNMVVMASTDSTEPLRQSDNLCLSVECTSLGGMRVPGRLDRCLRQSIRCVVAINA